MKRITSKINWKRVLLLVIIEISLIVNIVLTKAYLDSIRSVQYQAQEIEKTTKLISVIGEKDEHEMQGM